MDESVAVAADRLLTAEAVRSYKRLAAVERAFRSLRTVGLKVRPIHHRKADRVRAAALGDDHPAARLHAFIALHPGMLELDVEAHIR